MEKVKITCTQTGVTVGADVLERSNRRIRVALDNTDITLNLNRVDGSTPYIGNHVGLEFTTNG